MFDFKLDLGSGIGIVSRIVAPSTDSSHNASTLVSARHSLCLLRHVRGTISFTQDLLGFARSDLRDVTLLRDPNGVLALIVGFGEDDIERLEGVLFRFGEEVAACQRQITNQRKKGLLDDREDNQSVQGGKEGIGTPMDIGKHRSSGHDDHKVENPVTRS